ncbi:hypothetical protein UFOVP194_40 [uncultured Caudovirales phage]|uniref:DNA transfer protein n=1 Tax=uncultured Caudovirales phage TaxID=2100421 RepID=A0A6J7WG38_9CAUD|nr:hypothetical protein UFOVP194_40 [uncultured Caudovirales phage]
MFSNKFGVGVLKHPGYNDPVSAAISVGGSLLSGAMGADAASSAADTQAATARDQMALQKQIFDVQNAQQAPYRAAGYNALNKISEFLPGTYNQYDANGNIVGTGTGSDYLTRQFTNADLTSNLAPNYAWQLDQGQRANNAAANVGGGALSGNTLKSLQDYTQNYAGGAYQNALTNFSNQRKDIYNTLAGIAGIGQTANTASNTLATNYGTNTANLATGAAAAQAAGGVGAANAWSGAINNATNMYGLSNILGGGGSPTFGSGTMSSGGGISLAPNQTPSSWLSIG